MLVKRIFFGTLRPIEVEVWSLLSLVFVPPADRRPCIVAPLRQVMVLFHGDNVGARHVSVSLSRSIASLLFR